MDPQLHPYSCPTRGSKVFRLSCLGGKSASVPIFQMKLQSPLSGQTEWQQNHLIFTVSDHEAVNKEPLLNSLT
jgi:hypothetical protein